MPHFIVEKIEFDFEDALGTMTEQEQEFITDNALGLWWVEDETDLVDYINTGHTKAEYHTPGNSILGNSDGAPPVAEKTITVDDLLISSAFVYELDETLAHYELRGEISKKIGYALAQKYDRLVFRAIARGARAASPITKSGFVEPGGTQIRVGTNNQASDAYSSSALINAFYDAAAALDEKGVSLHYNRWIEVIHR